jgi:nucleotide-binding universal stress UspA family protein
MISRILVAVDGSQHADKALEYASNLAKKTGARLIIVHVAEEFRNIGYSITRELEQRNRAMLQKYQSKAKKLVKRKYVNTIEVKGNDIGEEILKTSDKEKIDTIVVGSRGIRENKEFLLGSISYKVSHYAKCPVIIVR